MKLLDKENTGLLVIDVQEKLMDVMGQKQRVTDNIIKLLHLSALFELPVILTEQYPLWPPLPPWQTVLETVFFKELNCYAFSICVREGFSHIIG